ncbi:MAG: trehalose-phosphatase [Ectothiorhodospiraceae bacterium]
MSDTRLPEPSVDWALFLDFDGTLVELADRPELVQPARCIPDLLRRLSRTLGGAVAIVSGRSLEGLTQVLGELDLPMAGVHGLERRDARGDVHRAVDRTESFRESRAALERFVREHPGTQFEDKGNALALHYRGAPQLELQAEAFLRAECQRLGEEFQVQRGKQVFELKPTAHHKGTVVATFLEEPPFRDRVPVFIGDDITDEDAFRVVNERGGHAIRVGPLAGSQARWSVESVDKVLQWLDSLPARLANNRQGDS